MIAPMQIQAPCVVSLSWRLEDAHGQLIDDLAEPLEFLVGGDDLFPELAAESLAKQRILADDAEILRRDPQIVFGSWCGKKFQPGAVAARAGWGAVSAVRDGQLFEIKSPIILQPGPAALTDGLAEMHAHIARWVAARA